MGEASDDRDGPFADSCSAVKDGATPTSLHVETVTACRDIPEQPDRCRRAAGHYGYAAERPGLRVGLIRRTHHSD